MVSMVNSPPLRGACVDMGLPSGFARGEVSKPFTEADLLVGGDVENPCEETGERTGEGDLFCARDVKEFSPAEYIESLLPACSACSD